MIINIEKKEFGLSILISWGYGNNDIPDTVKGWRPSGLQLLVSMFILTSTVSEFSDILLVPKCLTLVWRRR